MHDEAGVTLNARDIAAVVVDAVAVEGERRVTEEQHGVGHDLAAELLVARRGCGGRLRRIGRRRIAVDDVVFLAQRQALGVAEVVAHADENQCTAAALFHGHVLDRRHARDRLAHTQGLQKVEPATGPHAARQGHGRQEAPTFGVPVLADFAVARERSEVEPVPERRQHRAGIGCRIIAVQGGRQGCDGRGDKLILAAFAAADPVA